VITERHGLPVAVQTTPANWRDDKPALALIAQVPALPRCVRRRRPRVLLGDRAYGTARILLTLMLRLGMLPKVAPHGKHSGHGSGLGKKRYVVERTFSWFGHFRRIRACYERKGAHFQAFHELAAAVICFRRVQWLFKPVLK
jgi:transposase